jgi:hypothetical protein
MLPRNWCENPFKTAVSSLSTARPRAHFGLLRNWGARPPRARRRTPSSAAASAPARAGTRASSSISTPRVSPLWTFTRTLPVPGHRYLRQRIIQGKFPPPSLNAAPPFGVRRQSVAAGVPPAVTGGILPPGPASGSQPDPSLSLQGGCFGSCPACRPERAVHGASTHNHEQCMASGGPSLWPHMECPAAAGSPPFNGEDTSSR